MEEQLGYPRRLLLSHTMARSLDQVHPGQLGTNVTHILKRARYLVDYPVFRAANKAGRDITVRPENARISPENAESRRTRYEFNPPWRPYAALNAARLAREADVAAGG